MTDRARPYVVTVSDNSPRAEQEIAVTAHVDFPINAAPLPDLIWDWGDGTEESDLALFHNQDITRTHNYSHPGSYTLRLTASRNGDDEETTVSFNVQRPRLAVALFYPFYAELRIDWREQERIVDTIERYLDEVGVETRTFLCTEQQALADWMQPYLDDGVRDLILVLDVIPRALYAGESDGSLAEDWLESGNGILFSGEAPFSVYAGVWGRVDDTSAGVFGLDEVLDARTLLLGYGSGFQQLEPRASRFLPSLRPFQADRGIHLDRLGAEWMPWKIFARDLSNDVSDAVLLKHVSGGVYFQGYCTPSPPSARAEVLVQLLGHLFTQGRATGQSRPPTPGR